MERKFTPEDVVVAIPTYNNINQLAGALVSLVRNTDFRGRILVINNGETRYEDVQALIPYEVDWIDAGSNLGWCGGINLALKNSDHPLFCMANDDILFPVNREFWSNTVEWFNQERMAMRAVKVGGVGPCSNYVSGYQNMHLHGMPDRFSAPLLIGFFATYLREALGDGLDESLPGGDDYDLSIRCKKARYDLVVDRRLFVYHYGSQTGQRVHPGAWDTQQHQMDTYNALVRKHGLSAWYSTMNGPISELDGSWSISQTSLSPADSLNAMYHYVLTQPSDIHEHLRTLRTFAASCESVTEFGTDDCTSTIALLHAHPKKLTCYDIVRKPQVDEVMKMTNGTQFKFIQKSTLEVEIEPTDMLWIDDLHTYDQVSQELKLHAGKVKKYILFHDTETLGENGEAGVGTGIVPAITEFLRDHPEWVITDMHPNNNGLMALTRIA